MLMLAREGPVISRRRLLVGSVGVAATGLLAACGGTRRHSDAAVDAPETTEPPKTAAGTRGQGIYPTDVPRMPADLSKGVPGWATDVAGAQLVQAPL